MGIYKMHISEINIEKCVSMKSVSGVESTTIVFDNLVKVKKIAIKNVLMDEKNYKDLVIYFTRYVHSKSIKIFSLNYYELMGKIEELEENI